MQKITLYGPEVPPSREGFEDSRAEGDEGREIFLGTSSFT